MIMEGKIIDAGTLLIAIRDDPSINGANFARVKRHLEEAKAVDAVEVVRCKDCGYWKYMEEYYGECSHPRFCLDGHPDPTMEMNGFCSCGERREGE